MAEVIYKHSVRLEDITDDIEVALPIGAKVVSVAEQYPGELAFWFRCNPAGEPFRRHFVVVGTGHEFDPTLIYLGTAVCARGSLILHLLERP